MKHIKIENQNDWILSPKIVISGWKFDLKPFGFNALWAPAYYVTPAQAGVHCVLIKCVDAHLRGHDILDWSV